MDATFTQGDIIPTDWLAGTIWAESEASIVGTLIPNFFIVYFGQDLPYGNIDNNKVMLQLAHMGPGYELWADTAKDAVDNFDNISSILDKIDDDEHPERIKQYLDPNRQDKSLPLAKANGPFGSMTMVQTSDYPAAALSIKKFFCPAPVAPSAAIFPTGNVMTLQLPGNINKEAEAKKGLVKLMLFHV